MIRENITPRGDGNIYERMLRRDFKNKREYNSERRRKLILLISSPNKPDIIIRENITPRGDGNYKTARGISVNANKREYNSERRRKRTW